MSNMTLRLSDFLSYFFLLIPERDLNTKKTTPNPENFGARLEHGLLQPQVAALCMLLTLFLPSYCYSLFLI